MITKEYLQQELTKRIKGYKPGVETTTDNIISEMESILVLVDALQDRVKDYDDALEKAKAAHKDTDKHIKATVERIFPELRESEEETTRKELLDFVKSFWADHKEALPQTSRWVTYLEKQKDDFENSCQLGIMQEQARQELEWTDEKQKEQKPTISDEAIREGIVHFGITQYQIDNWLKKHINIVEYQPAEWSEEDETIIEGACNALEIHGHTKLASKLKSLHPQPHWKKSFKTADLENSLCDLQDNYHDGSYEYKVLGEAIEFIRCTEPIPSWKPSDEQMEGLKFFLEFHRSQRNAGTINWREYDAIESLYEQLKKL